MLSSDTGIKPLYPKKRFLKTCTFNQTHDDTDEELTDRTFLRSNTVRFQTEVPVECVGVGV